jgi:S-adenosylmethionine decarboxylase
LTDLNEIFNFLNELPEKIGMTKISQPHVFKYSGAVPDDWGVTGVVILAESHCSIHTFPDREGFVTLDIYSCKDFPADKVITEIERFFQSEAYECKIIQRGESFCRNEL